MLIIVMGLSVAMIYIRLGQFHNMHVVACGTVVLAILTWYDADADGRVNSRDKDS
jgi:hypothetical protein